jgi:hypothetical protein
MTKPVIAFSTLSSIAMVIGILIICFTAPKQTGTSFLFYILHIQHEKNQRYNRFILQILLIFGNKTHIVLTFEIYMLKADHKTRTEL